MSLPFLSVIVPCRNEEDLIKQCLDSIVGNEYPSDRFEVIVVDGASVDGTQAIVEEYCSRSDTVSLIVNSGETTPVGLNLGIRAARGDIIVIMGAHAKYPQSYLRRCVECVERTNADAVGGPIETVPRYDSPTGRAIAMCLSSRIGVGWSRFRTDRSGGFVDSVPFGAYRRTAFEKYGLFDERLDRNQDNEFASRITARGGRIYMAPELEAVYYSVSTIGELMRYGFETGLWHVPTVRINRQAFRVRYFVPFGFLLSVVSLLALAPWLGPARLALGVVVGAYGAIAVSTAVRSVVVIGVRGAAIVPLALSAYHLAYGLGTAIGFLKRTKEIHRKAVQIS